MGDKKIMRFVFQGADFEISVNSRGFLVVDIATADIEQHLFHPGGDAIPKVRIVLNETSIQTTADGPWESDDPRSFKKAGD